MPLAGELVDGQFEPGFVCYGVPISSDSYVAAMLDKKVAEVAEGARKAQELLGDERQGLWTLLRASLKFQFEYWLGLCYPSDVLPAARRVDAILQGVMEAVAGQHIPLVEEGLGVEECLTIPVAGLTGRSLQSWLLRLPIRDAGMGLTSQEELVPAAFIGALEQALPYFGGEAGVCPPLAHLVGDTHETRYAPLVASNHRTGRELARAWEGMVREAREANTYLASWAGTWRRGPSLSQWLGWGKETAQVSPGKC